jgi:hypothetical protein
MMMLMMMMMMMHCDPKCFENRIDLGYCILSPGQP